MYFKMQVLSDELSYINFGLTSDRATSQNYQTRCVLSFGSERGAAAVIDRICSSHCGVVFDCVSSVSTGPSRCIRGRFACVALTTTRRARF
jgi:hypothetical protein